MTALFRWPQAGRVGQVVPKERLYRETSADAAVRRRFVDEVAQVRWAYKLGEASVRLPETAEVAEIQVFEIDLKGADVHTSVLTAIDRAIPSPIVFELLRDDGLWAEQAVAASFKRPGARGPRLSEYFRTGWVSTEVDRVPLPVAVDMQRLYEQLVGALLPHPLRPTEPLVEGIQRMTRICALEREVAALGKRLRSEPQFNRKADLRRALAERRAELTTLTGAG
jgi:hypothetical protein